MAPQPMPDVIPGASVALEDVLQPEGRNTSVRRSSLEAQSKSAFVGYGSVAASASRTSAWLSDSAFWLEHSKQTDPVMWMGWCLDVQDELRPRKIRASGVVAWLLLQCLGNIFQISLLTEIGTHLTTYEHTLQEFCRPEHMRGGVCLGPSWNLSFSRPLTFMPNSGQGDASGGFDFVVGEDIKIEFPIASKPPTFLIGVEPLSPFEHAAWKFTFGQHLGFGGFPITIPPVHGHGSRYWVQVRRTWPRFSLESNSVEHWSGFLALAGKYSDSVTVNVYIIDSRIKHAADIHRQQQCSFEASWQNFNERHSGRHHQVLNRAWYFTWLCLVGSTLSTGVMLRRFLHRIEGGNLLSRLVVLKLFLLDLPQQLCIALYIYAWYAQNGLRCQMCLFHPQHCDDEYPLHWSNLMVCLFTIMSSCSNQFLIQIVPRKRHDEEELVQCCLRIGMISLSTLPFSTATLLLSFSVLQLRSLLVYFIAGSLCLVGWSSLLCLPLTAICDDDF